VTYPSGKKKPIQAESGFTLMEMLIAVTLVAMLAVGMWSVFSVSVRSWSRGTEFIDNNQRHRSILDKVRKQIASAFPLYGSNNLEQPGGSSFIFTGTENSMRFVTLNSLKFQESPGLTLVSFEVVEGVDGTHSLVQTEARYTGQILDPALMTNLSGAIPIFEDLSSCVFEYYDPGNNDNTAQWVQSWDGEAMRKFPAAVSITMIARDPRGNSLNRHMVVPIRAEAHQFQINRVNPLGGRIRAVVR
jgi:prepilin-type N-terminal cleavage/methylation domain-containing protein